MLHVVTTTALPSKEGSQPKHTPGLNEIREACHRSINARFCEMGMRAEAKDLLQHPWLRRK